MLKVTPILGERLRCEEGSGHLPSREIAEHQFGLRLGVELHVVNSWKNNIPPELIMGPCDITQKNMH